MGAHAPTPGVIGGEMLPTPVGPWEGTSGCASKLGTTWISGSAAATRMSVLRGKSRL